MQRNLLLWVFDMTVYQIELKHNQNFELAYDWCLANIGEIMIRSKPGPGLLSDFEWLDAMNANTITWDYGSSAITLPDKNNSKRFVTVFYINSSEHATQFALMGF